MVLLPIGAAGIATCQHCYDYWPASGCKRQELSARKRPFLYQVRLFHGKGEEGQHAVCFAERCTQRITLIQSIFESSLQPQTTRRTLTPTSTDNPDFYCWAVLASFHRDQGIIHTHLTISFLFFLHLHCSLSLSFFFFLSLSLCLSLSLLLRLFFPHLNLSPPQASSYRENFYESLFDVIP